MSVGHGWFKSKNQNFPPLRRTELYVLLTPWLACPKLACPSQMQGASVLVRAYTFYFSKY